MKSKIKDRSLPWGAIWASTPRNENTLGEVHPSKLMWIRPGYSCNLKNYVDNERKWYETRETNLKKFSYMDFRNAMNLLYVPRNCCFWGGFYLCIQHFEDALEWWIFNDGEWSMALKDPTWDEVSKFGFIVCGSVCVDSNALGWIDNLALARLDVANKIGRGIFLASASQNDWGVSIHDSWDRMSRNKWNADTYVRQANWYFTTLFSTIITGALKWL